MKTDKIEKIKKIIEEGNKQFKTNQWKFINNRFFFPKETKKQEREKLEHNFLVCLDIIQKIEEVIKK